MKIEFKRALYKSFKKIMIGVIAFVVLIFVMAIIFSLLIFRPI